MPRPGAGAGLRALTVQCCEAETPVQVPDTEYRAKLRSLLSCAEVQGSRLFDFDARCEVTCRSGRTSVSPALGSLELVKWPAEANQC